MAGGHLRVRGYISPFPEFSPSCHWRFRIGLLGSRHPAAAAPWQFPLYQKSPFEWHPRKREAQQFMKGGNKKDKMQKGVMNVIRGPTYTRQGECQVLGGSEEKLCAAPLALWVHALPQMPNCPGKLTRQWMCPLSLGRQWQQSRRRYIPRLLPSLLFWLARCYRVTGQFPTGMCHQKFKVEMLMLLPIVVW